MEVEIVGTDQQANRRYNVDLSSLLERCTLSVSRDSRAVSARGPLAELVYEIDDGGNLFFQVEADKFGVSVRTRQSLRRPIWRVGVDRQIVDILERRLGHKLEAVYKAEIVHHGTSYS